MNNKSGECRILTLRMPRTPLNFQEIGSTGLPVYSGMVYDEPLGSRLTAEQWRRAVRDMTSNDASIGSLLFMIEMIARQVKWEIVPWDKTPEQEQTAGFIRECLFEDMQQTWQDTLAEILSFLPWGWAWFEIVYKRRGGPGGNKTNQSRYDDNRIGWRKWAIRAQESLYEWRFDEWNEVTAMVQQPPPDFDIKVIPFEKSLHFRTSLHKQNPEGISILRRAYRSWYFKSNIENIEGIGIERDYAGLPVIYCPPELFKSNATNEEKQMLNYLKQLATGIRRDEQSGIVFPLSYDTAGNESYRIQLLSTGGQRQIDTSGVIDRYDQRMLMTAMADFLLLGSKATGTYALGETKWKSFIKSMKAWLDSIADTVNRFAIPRLLNLNGIQVERVPYLQPGSLEEISLEALGSFVDTMQRIGITFSEDQQNYLKRRAAIPIDEQ